MSFKNPKRASRKHAVKIVVVRCSLDFVRLRPDFAAIWLGPAVLYPGLTGAEHWRVLAFMSESAPSGK
eukprot:4834602-Amphidinium_carterae.1